MRIISSSQTLNAILESGFIQNILFAGVPYSTQLDPSRFEESVLIYLELYEINLDFIMQAKALGKKIVLYHMGDERGDKDLKAYAQCDLIIRNYFFPHIHYAPELRHKILWAPNGYKTGVGPRNPNALLQAPKRQYLACFLGWLSNTASFNGERSLFTEAVSAGKDSWKRQIKGFWQWINHYRTLSKDYQDFTSIAPRCTDDLHLLGSRGFSSGYNVGLYSAIMENSVFAPCPAGNSPETIRLYDALECGCIPVLLSHEFALSTNALAEFESPPFTFLKSWSEFPAFLSEMKNQLKTNPQIILDQQKRCIAWWVDYQRQIGQKIKMRIANLT